MGMGNNELKLLRLAHASNGMLGKTLTVGRQEFAASAKRELKKLGFRRSAGELYIDRLLVEHFGATSVDSLDYSDYEGATLLADLNLPLDQTELTAFDSVIDFGSIEHVFDIAQALKNLAGLLAPGGIILHSSPTNGHSGHGFWQVSPSVFGGFYSKNQGFRDCQVFIAQDYGLFSSGTWWNVLPTSNRSNVLSPARTSVMCMATKNSQTQRQESIAIQQLDYLEAWSDLSPSPSRSARLRNFLKGLPFLGQVIRGLANTLVVENSLGRAALVACGSWLYPFRLSRTLRRLNFSKVLKEATNALISDR